MIPTDLKDRVAAIEHKANAPTVAYLKISLPDFELEMRGPTDDMRDVLAVLTDRLVIAFGKAREAGEKEKEAQS